MVKIEGFPLLGVHRVLNLPILFTPMRNMLDHEFNISSTGEHILQVIDNR
jgi:hypothetical protein